MLYVIHVYKSNVFVEKYSLSRESLLGGGGGEGLIKKGKRKGGPPPPLFFGGGEYPWPPLKSPLGNLTKPTWLLASMNCCTCSDNRNSNLTLVILLKLLKTIPQMLEIAFPRPKN